MRTLARSAKICSPYEPCATPKPSNSHRSTLRVTCPIGAVSLRLRQRKRAGKKPAFFRCGARRVRTLARSASRSSYEPCVTPKPSNSHRSTLRVTCPKGSIPPPPPKREKHLCGAFSSCGARRVRTFLRTSAKNLFALRALCDTEAVKLPPEHAASNLPHRGSIPPPPPNGKSTLAVLFLVAVCGG